MTIERPMFPPRAESVDSFSGGSSTPAAALATPHGPDDVNSALSGTLGGYPAIANSIPVVDSPDIRRGDSGAEVVDPAAIAPMALTSRRGFLMNTMISAASLSTATAVALPTARAQPGPREVSFPPGIVDRLVRIRERSFIQRQKDKAHRLADTDPFYEDEDKVWDELQEEQRAAADAVLSRSPQSIADLAWQTEAVLICDGPDMLDSSEVYGLIQLFENVRALAGPLAIPTTVSFPEIVDPVFAVIERHKALSVAFDAAAGNATAFHQEYGELHASGELIEQAEKMFEFRPASLSGVVTLLKYIASLEDWQMPGRFSEPEDIEGMQDLCRTMAAAIEPFSAVRRVATSSFANAGADPIFAAIEAHRCAHEEFNKADAAADVGPGRAAKQARILVGLEDCTESSWTETGGGGFTLVVTPSGRKEPVYASCPAEIWKNAPKDLQGDARQAWIEARLAELEAAGQRIAKRHARTKLGKLETARDKAYDVERALLWDLIWTEPTSAAGLAALLGYFRERGSINELIGGDDDMEDVLQWTMECAACALASLPKPPMSEIVADAWKSRNEDDASEEAVTA
jgi:hypothetical protein